MSPECPDFHNQPEVEPTPQIEPLYVVLDGPGATGKTSISLQMHLAFNHFISPEIEARFVNEPPHFKELGTLGIPGPYQIITQGLICREAAIPYLAAVRRMMWGQQL